ncbi:hypothetical protein [Candidatus Hepatobacter penaei]|uniref:hypothetical protein n=1 Tax=Candidatus Hepatobacter penaei TaxID=1274402 RepID=UPI0012E092C6|nr:hypothetical protein [Candidatus Hepatobacter penaei]
MRRLLFLALSSVILWQTPVLGMRLDESDSLTPQKDQMVMVMPTKTPPSSPSAWVYGNADNDYGPITSSSPLSTETTPAPSRFWTTKNKVIAGGTGMVAGVITAVMALTKLFSSHAQAADLTTFSWGLTTSEAPLNMTTPHGQAHGPQSSLDIDRLTTHVLTSMETTRARYGDTEEEIEDSHEKTHEDARWKSTTATSHRGSSTPDDCLAPIAASLRTHVRPLVNSLMNAPAQARRDCHLLFGITSLTLEGLFDPTFDVPGFQASLKQMLTCQGLSCDNMLDDNLIIPTQTGVMPACLWEDLSDFFKNGYGSSCYRSLLKKYHQVQEIADRETFVCWMNWAMHVMPNDDAAPYALVKQVVVCPFD